MHAKACVILFLALLAGSGASASWGPGAGPAAPRDEPPDAEAAGDEAAGDEDEDETGRGGGSDEPGLDLSDPRHVRAVYLDLLGRTPDRDEVELASGSRPDVLLRRLVGGADFWDQWYEEELYYFLLVDNARPERPASGQSLPSLLAAGAMSMPDAVRFIATSQAFHRANPGNDTFVSVVLEQFLGITVQRDKAMLEAGKKMYDGRSASLFSQRGDSQADVVRIVTSQDGFHDFIMLRQYQRFLGEAPPRDLLAELGRRLREEPGSYEVMVKEWLLSPRYAERVATLRTKNDRQFIRGLFMDLTGRLPPPVTLQRLRTAMAALADAGPLRSVIARVLLDGELDRLPERDEIEDVEEWIEETFLRFLGRPPSAEELQDFALIWRQEDAGPATVVAALVTHWEYQHY